MSLRFRHIFRLGKNTGVIWSIPLTSGKRGEGIGGCLGALLLGLFGLVGAISNLFGGSEASPKQALRSTLSVVQAPAVDAGEITPSSAPSLPPTIDVPETSSLPTVEPSSPTGLPISDARGLFDSLQMASRGFSFSEHKRHNPWFWVFRKTDPEREYSVVVINGDKCLRSVSAEFVGRDGVDGLSNTFFSTLFPKVVSNDFDHVEASEWIKGSLSSGRGSKDFGSVRVEISGASAFHRRIVFSRVRTTNETKLSK